LRRGAASSFVVGSRRRVGQFALPRPAPRYTAFNRSRFHPLPYRRGTEITAWDLPAAADLLRPSAEEAWPYVRASGALCRAAESRPRAPAPRLRAPCRVALSVMTTPSRDATTRRLPPRQARRDHRRVRTTDNERTRAPSIGSTRSLAARAGSATLVVHVRSFAPHPVICRDPEPVSSKTGRSLQTIPRSCARLDHSRQPRSTRERCASPTSATDSTTRAPCGLLDSRLRPRLT